MGNNPKVSVCIPCFNAERYLAQALESVLAQSYSNIEVVAVDDGSSDDTALILSHYVNRGVVVLRQPNLGQCAAANRAYAASSGDLIKFFDADDVLAPGMIEQQVARMGDRRDAVAMGEWVRFYGACPNNEEFSRLPMYRDAAPADWLAVEWTRARPMMQCALWLIPRAILQRAGQWDERLSVINDFEFFARVLAHATEILYTPGARVYYRSGTVGSLSGRKNRTAAESAWLSLMLGTQHLLNIEDSPRTRLACANILQGFEYTYYPEHRDLRARARQRVAELGGAKLAPDGPPGFHKLRHIIGWRLARRAQRLAETLGLNASGRRRSWRQLSKMNLR